MKRKSLHKGMTLVELMAVVAIIGLLAGIMVFFVSRNSESRAQVDLANDILSLLQAQRTRAATMNVAAYVRFSAQPNGGNMFVEPRLGDTSACIGSIASQRPILYQAEDLSVDDSNANDNIVRIDLNKNQCTAEILAEGQGTGRHHKCRTLESQQDTKYAGNVALGFDLRNIKGDSAGVTLSNQTLVVCFQPNGQAYFLGGDGESADQDWLDMVTTANIFVYAANDVSDSRKLTVSVTNLGMIYSNNR